MTACEKITAASTRFFSDRERLIIGCLTMGFGYGWAAKQASEGEWARAILSAIMQVILSWGFDIAIRAAKASK